MAHGLRAQRFMSKLSKVQWHGCGRCGRYIVFQSAETQLIDQSKNADHNSFRSKSKRNRLYTLFNHNILNLSRNFRGAQNCNIMRPQNVICTCSFSMTFFFSGGRFLYKCYKSIVIMIKNVVIRMEIQKYKDMLSLNDNILPMFPKDFLVRVLQE